jgi:hypothetical protein
MMMSLVVCALTEYWGDKIEEDEIGRACGTFGGKEKCRQSFGGETSRKVTAWKT